MVVWYVEPDIYQILKVVFAAEGMFRVALNTVEADIDPVRVISKVFPLLENDTPFPLVNVKLPSTPLVSDTLVLSPTSGMVGAVLLVEDVKLGIFLAD